MSEDYPRVSVIIPTYNRLSTLRRALKSVCAQTYPRLECIVYDDGSTDDTARCIPQEYPTVRFMRAETTRGVSYARNRAIEKASGTYIAFLDSDDAWKEEKIFRQIAYMRAHTLFVCQTDEVWIRRGVCVNPMKKHEKRSVLSYVDLLPLCLVSPSAVVIHKDVFMQTGLFDESLPACEDYDMWLRIRPHYEIHTLKEALTIKYGGHDDQLSKAFTAIDRFRIKALVKSLRSGNLSDCDYAAARAVLLEKCRVLVNGFRKRGNSEAALVYEDIIERFKN